MREGFAASVLLIAFTFFVSPSPCADSPVNRQGTKQNQTKKSAQPSGKLLTLSGCVDEGDSGKYVLVDDSRLSAITQLQADGFPNEGFAKYLGQKVTVQGKSSEGGGRSIFAVKKIEMVSETCTPTRPSQ
jgi:hypothetical protein